MADAPESYKFGNYQTIREIGRGGMGIVYEARHTGTGERVAVKVLPRNRSGDARTLERFLREAEAARRISNPHIIPIYDVGSDPSGHWFAMAFIDGCDLESLIFRLRAAGEGGAAIPPAGPPSRNVRSQAYIAWVVERVAEIAEALHLAHEQGLVHRDIKPSNLLLDVSGRLILTDFGLVRDVRRQTFTLTGEVLGTPVYMSPEQIAARRKSVDRRTDVYSLGVTLYEALALVPPFDAEDLPTLIRAIQEDDPDSIGKHNPAVSPALDAIVQKAIRKDRRRRYPTTAAMAADLRAFLEGRRIEARPTGRTRRAIRRVVRIRGVASGLLVAGTIAVVAGVILGGQAVNRGRHRQAEISGTLRVAASSEASGALDRAMQEVRHVLAIEPGHPEALARRAALVERARTQADTLALAFEFSRAAETLRWLEAWGELPAGQAGRAALYSEIGYRRVEAHARALFTEEASSRRRAAQQLLRPAEFYSLPRSETERLVVSRIGLEAEEDVRALLVAVAGAFRIEAAVPALVDAAGAASSERLLHQIARALRTTGDPRGVPGLVAVLGRARVREAREEAILGLGVAGGDAAAEALVRVVRGPEELPLRIAAAESLGRIGAAFAAADLRRLHDELEKPEDRAVLVRALAALSDPTGASWIEAVAGGPEAGGARKEAILGLGRLPGEPAFRALVRIATEHTDASARRHAVEVLGARPEAARVEVIVRATRDRDATVRGAAVIALAHTGDPRHASVAAELLTGDGSAEVQSAAAFALGSLARGHADTERTVRPALVRRLLESRVPVVRSMTAWALGEVGDASSLPALVALLEEEDDSGIDTALRGVVKASMGILGSERSPFHALVDELGVVAILMPPLFALTSAGRTPPRAAAAAAIGTILERHPKAPASAHAVALLARILASDADARVRARAAAALGRCRAEDTGAALRRSLAEEPDRDVTAAAAVALARIGLTVEARDHFQGSADLSAGECLAFARVLVTSGDAVLGLDQIERAVALGLASPAPIEADADLVVLRTHPECRDRFAALCSLLRRRAAGRAG